MDRPPDEVAAGPITLVRYRGTELDALLRAVLQSVEHLRPWMPWAARPPSATEQGEWLRSAVEQWETGENFNFWMREAESGEFVGACGLHGRAGPDAFEIGYWVRVDRTRRGYATQAASALTAAAFGLRGVRKVEIHCNEANTASAAVPRRLGYRLDHIEDDEIHAPGETGRSMIWVTDAETWGAGR